jgi:apolipoprotein D and lipocalin family protein
MVALLISGAASLPLQAAAAPAPLQALPRLEVAPYMGTWYQVLWFPNFFQRQCVSDTAATYRDLGDGTVEVVNRCRTADGRSESITGIARPPRGAATIEAGWLQPARLEVSFLPTWLRWTGIGWGAYWVVDRAPDGRYVIVSEPSREYLWVLARKPALTPEDEATVRARLQALGFDLGALQAHPHGGR